MKKILSLLIVLVLVFSLVACGGSEGNDVDVDGGEGTDIEEQEDVNPEEESEQDEVDDVDTEDDADVEDAE